MASISLLALIAIIPFGIADDPVPVPISSTNLPLTGTSGTLIDVSAKGTFLWAIDSTNTVFQFDFGQQTWKPYSNQGIDADKKPRKIAATNEGGAWISTGPAKKNYRWVLGSTAWSDSYCPGCWYFPISAISDNHMLGLGWDLPTPRTIGENFASGQAPQLNGVPGFTTTITTATWVAIGDKKEHWYIDTLNQIYRYNFNSKVWDLMPGNVTGCSVDLQCGNRVVVTSTCGNSYIWDYGKNQWNQLPFTNVKFTTINYNSVFAVTKDGKVQQYTPNGYACPCTGECPAWVTGY